MDIIGQQGSLDGTFRFTLPCCGAPLEGRVAKFQPYRTVCCGVPYEVSRSTLIVFLYRRARHAL